MAALISVVIGGTICSSIYSAEPLDLYPLR